MKPRLPHFANTLLFRISATFLLLLGVSLGGWYLWIESTVFNPYADEAEEEWYENLAADELDDLAARLGALGLDSSGLAPVVEDYGRQVADFEAEVIVFDAAGRHMASSAPESLLAAVPELDADLLDRMSRPEWDYGTYPDPGNVDAYINRVFEVDRITEDGRMAGYLVASYRPVDMVGDDLNQEMAMINAQDRIVKMLVGLLIYSAVTALLIMAWTSRRVTNLSEGVAAFAAGDLGARVPVRSTDEIGQLGRNFNGMAAHIEEMVDKLRQKEQFQRQLIANVSHDLRTPMASMRGHLETLIMDADELDARRQERYLKIITGNLDHLDRLVEHMLVLSRFDSGQATFRMENFPLAELIDSILLRCEGLAAEEDVSLGMEIDPAVGLVHADPLQISQVLQNLVENAIKFNRTGGRVDIAVTREDDRVWVAVRDTGRGIPPEDLPRIFDRFFTGDESRTRVAVDPDRRTHGQHLAQSSGLGLAIAAKIVAGHDSILRVDSRLGEGSTFHFQLPHAEGERADSSSA